MTLANIARAFVIRTRLGLLFGPGRTKVDLNDLFSSSFATLTVMIGEGGWDTRNGLIGGREGELDISRGGREFLSYQRPLECSLLN